jgi:DNA-binding transcriptional LysR family regulator
MNRWKGILEFVAVVETGSFSRAAESLSISTSHVSKRVSELEGRVGVRLIHRSTRIVKPSAEGQIYYQSCKNIIKEFQMAEDLISDTRNTPNGNVKICYVGNSTPGYQVAFMSGFLKKYPEISVEAIYTDTLPNLIEGGIDLALVEGELQDCAFPSQRVAWIDHGLCASPKFFEHHVEPRHPNELENLPCIVSESDTWCLTQNGETVHVEVSGNWKSMNAKSGIDAAVCDLGVCLIPTATIPHMERQSKLIHILQGWTRRKPLHAVTQNREYVPVKLQLLQDFMDGMQLS